MKRKTKTLFKIRQTRRPNPFVLIAIRVKYLIAGHKEQAFNDSRD